MVRSKSLELLSKVLQKTMAKESIFISVSECKQLLEREGWTNHIDEDTYTVWCCLNTWCGVFQDITGSPGTILATQIRLNGLYFTINDADEARLDLQHERNVESRFWSRYVSDVSEESLTLTGLPRRLRVTGKGSSTEVVAFLKGNKKCRNHNRSLQDQNPNFKFAHDVGVIQECSAGCDDTWFDEYTHTPGFLLEKAKYLWSRIFKDWEQDSSLFCLPPGVSFEGARTYLEKFRIVRSQQQWLREHGVNIPAIPTMNFSEPANCCRYALVPKTFKSLRGIAPEPVSKQVLGYQIDSGMRTCLKKFGVDLSDQSRNQTISQRLDMATEDMTAASDSISLFLVSTVSSETPRLRDALMSIHSDYVIVENQKVKNFRYATMGNAVTFVVESAIFLIMCILSIDLQDNLNIGSLDNKIEDLTLQSLCLDKIAVYGDDCILPAKYHDTFVEVCRLFGFSVNLNKSFSNGRFRESCGAEWFDYKSVTGTYWPRGLSNEPLAELVSLQHKLVDYPTANSFLISVILDVFPDITQSEIGSPYQDIWCDNPRRVFKGCSKYAMILYIHQYTVKAVAKGLISLKSKANKSVWAWTITTTKPDGWGRMYDPLNKWSIHKYDRILLPVPAPHDDNYEVHTTIGSESSGKMSEDLREEVEYLAYLMTIGNGIEHVNNSPYTKTQDTILNRRDLVGKRKIKIANKSYPVGRQE